MIFLVGLMVGLVINSMLSGMFVRNGTGQTSLRSNKLDNADDVFDTGNEPVRLYCLCFIVSTIVIK